MANADRAACVLERAQKKGQFSTVIVVGTDQSGKAAFFADDADPEKMLVLIERAKHKLLAALEAK